MPKILTSLYLSALLLLLLVPNTLQQPPNLPNSVATAMASREMRYHHLLWHNLRNMWNALSANSRAQIEALGWRPPRPAKDSSGRALKNNNAGEDFLYMHRQMIALVNRLLDKAGAPHVSGFKTIPAANDRNFPMPPDYDAPSGLSNLVTYYKSNTYYQSMKKVEARCKDPNFLRSMTLGQFGSYLEFTSDIHQGMHFRFSSYTKLMRPKSAPAIPFIDPKWDVKSANWLADIYSSQINPWFWKLHGWIDDRINDWQKANGVQTIKWKGKWLGGSMQALPDSLEIPNNPNVEFGGSSTSSVNNNNNNNGNTGTTGNNGQSNNNNNGQTGNNNNNNGQTNNNNNANTGNNGQTGSNGNTGYIKPFDWDAEEDDSMDMGPGAGPDPNIGLDQDMDPTMSMNMDVTTMEAITKILIKEGLACDFYSDVGTVTIPEAPPAGPGNW